MHPPRTLPSSSIHPSPGLAPAIESALQQLRQPVPEDAVLAAFPEHTTAEVTTALEESAVAGRIVRDARGWVRLNPLFRSRSEGSPRDRERARVVAATACEAAPADLSLRVAHFALTDWDDPREVTAARTFFEQARFGLRARELVDKLDEADLLSPLIQLCPRDILALLLDGGRVEQASPLIGGHDPYLQALLALQEGRLDDARTWLGGVVGLPARFLRIEVCRAAFDYDAMESELASIPRTGLAPMDGPPGYAPDDLIILRGPILARLGEGTIHPIWPGITPYQECKLSLSNAMVALADGDLPEALTWCDRGVVIAGQRGLWDLGASLLLTRADTHIRSGHPDHARADLSRFDSLQRHEACYLRNLATVARACLDNTAPDALFIGRLVQQEDRIALAILAARWPVGPAAEALLTPLPEATCEQLEATFLAPRSSPVLILPNQARQIELPDGRALDFRRSGAPRRVRLALAEHRLAQPGHAIDADDLIQLGWPGERIQWEAARTRLYTVIRRLRARGIEGLETLDGGYRLSLDVHVVVDQDAPAS